MPRLTVCFEKKKHLHWVKAHLRHHWKTSTLVNWIIAEYMKNSANELIKNIATGNETAKTGQLIDLKLKTTYYRFKN